MTKTEKRLKILELLKQFIQSENPLDEEQIIENVIIEIYSCGYSSISKLNGVSNAINVFLTDIMNQTIEFGSKNWRDSSSIIGLLALVDTSELPDK